MSTGNSPNVVFILTDDQAPWAAGCYGNEEIRTPHLDRLAGEGVLFRNFFCASPVCSPARASLMTGRIPSQHGVHDWIRGGNMPPGAARYLDGQRCYTDVLAAAGYVCGLSGKWHLGDSLRPQHGFSHWFTLPEGSSRYNDADMIRNGQVVRCDGYLTDVITDDAVAFIRAQAGGPFYLSVSYNAPHSPWVGQHKPEIVDSYDACPFRSCPQEPAHRWIRPGMGRFLGDREALKGYFAAITGLDIGVGRILDVLGELGLRERTLVVFMSDNGFSCGQHGFWGKGNGTIPLNMYENSVKVPCIFSQPTRLPAGRVSDAMVSQYDFVHTLLEYLDLPPFAEANLPGRSFMPALLGSSDQHQEEVVICDEYGPVRMYRTAEWKYVHRYPNGPHELYDLANDPDERRNLVDEKSRQTIVRDLRQRLTDWFGRYVRPEMDGARFPVDGSGQAGPIGAALCGEEAFFREERR
jgi:arylsulfatase A-like enzyme